MKLELMMLASAWRPHQMAFTTTNLPSHSIVSSSQADKITFA